LLLCVFFAGGLAAGALHGQETSGSFGGTITDPSEAAVPDVKVTITNRETGHRVGTTTGKDGTYSSGNLGPGVYTVTFESTAFDFVTLDNVKLLVGQRLTIDRELTLPGPRTKRQVTAEVPLIDFQSPQKAHNITSEEHSRLPLPRTFTGFAWLIPGLTQGDIEGGIQVNGASAGENSYVIEGVVTSSLLYGNSRMDTIAEYLQDVQFKVGGMDAEHGGALGGVISGVTKTGSADYHGGFFYYYGGSGISAGPVRRLQLSPVDNTTVSYEQDTRQPVHRNEPGASLGGPLPFAKDKLFFFTSVSPRVTRSARHYLFSNGTEPGVLKQDQTTTQVFGKITYLGGRTRVNGTFLTTPTRNTGLLRAYKGTGPNFTVESKTSSDPLLTQGFDVNKYLASFNMDVTLNRSSYIAFRGGHFYDNYNETGFLLTTPYLYRTSSVGASNIPPELQGPVGFGNVPARQTNQKDRTTRTSADLDYSLLFKVLGRHVLKAGARIERLSYAVDAGYPGGQVQLFWNASVVGFNGGSPDTGTYGYYRVVDVGFKGQVAANRGAFYIQDQWTLVPGLTLNVGLRAENEKVPMFRGDIRKYGYEFGFGDKLAPRVGAAYDLLGNGKVKLYGSWGRYFDVTRYSISRELFGGSRVRGYYRSLDTLAIDTLNLDNMPGRDLWGDPRGYQEFIPTVTNVDPNIKPMYQDSVNAGVEYQLDRSTVLAFHFVHSDLGRAVEDIAVNGSTFLIGNPGEGAAAVIQGNAPTPDFAVPRAKRQYDAISFTATRRLLTKWFGSFSYTYSRLYGNFAGIADTDQIVTPTTGVQIGMAQSEAGVISRPGVNGNLAYDSARQLWDSKGNLNVLGRLATDRPHALKLYGGYTLPNQTNIAFVFFATSGTPITTYVISNDGHPVMVNGRGDMGRTPVLSRTDLMVFHEIALKDTQKVRFEFNVLNVFNQKTVTHVFNFFNKGAPGGSNTVSTGSINLNGVNLANGYNHTSLLLATPDGVNAFDPRYGQPDLWAPGLQGQLSLKFTY
jgi:hypothetical protein